MSKSFWIAAAALLLTIGSAEAANRYVRAGATGGADGSDWTNAYTKLPSSLVRGDTYFIADGEYGPYTFSDAPSGTTLIVVKKATVADHGTSAGWVDAYGDGEALFTGSAPIWKFKPGTGYYEILGQTGVKGVAGSYGFRVKATGSRNSADAMVTADRSGTYSDTGNNQHIYFDRVDFDWNNGSAAGSSGATRVIEWITANGNSGIHFSNCYMHHSSGFAIYSGSIDSDLVVDNCVFEKNGGASQYHHETLWVTGANGFTFRNNVMKDTLNGALTGWLMLGTVSNANIYNNVFTCTSPTACFAGGNGIIATWDANQYANSNIVIANNTFANLPTSGNPAIYFYHSGGAVDQNVVVQNNIFFTGSFSVTGAATNQSNSCGGGAKCSGSNPQDNLATSIFRDWSKQDFRLTAHTLSGVSTNFVTDQDGLSRSSDGVWDRGAFEYRGGVATPPAPVNLTVK